MFQWAPYPFIRLTLFFCLGIIGGIYWPNSLSINIAIFFFFGLSAIYLLVSILQSRGRWRSINPGVIGLPVVVLSGFVLVYFSSDIHHRDHFIHDPEPIEYYQVVVTHQAQEKNNSWKVEAEVLAVRHPNGWGKRTGKVLLYFSKKAFKTPFVYGDVLLIKGGPRLLEGPANPGEFDYKRFLTFKKIYHQHFLRNGDVHYKDHQPPNWFIDYSIRARMWAQQVINQYVKGDREQATVSALVLGVTDGLDNDLLSAYAATGSLHVLSVSGLHIGIIYWLILLVLKPLNKSATGKWILALLSIVLLWGYAFITGLSPSVLRAVTMFSFVAMARPISRRTNIYNTLAASAFCLLLYEPYLLMSVGFQLSYLAVIGIVYLQPIFSRLWEPKSWLWDNVWQITCVSMAAQLATFALGLLYFHQFPVYFLFSNLFVIPLSFVVLITGIALIAVGAIGPVAVLLGVLLEWIIRLLNFGVVQMESLPFSLVDHVYITTFQCWLLIAAIVFTLLLFQSRKFRFALAAAVCMLTFSAIQWNHFSGEISQRKLTVYNVSGFSALDFFDHGQAYFLADSTLKEDKERIRFHIRPNRLRSGIDRVDDHEGADFSHQYRGCRLIVWRGITLLQVSEKEFSFPEKLTINYVVVKQNAITSVRDLAGVNFEKLILDSSNSFYFADRIVKEAQEASIRVHSVLHDGSFVTKL
ncbi:MAG: ComEC/Rec2 family competence protein [Cyclobacteriaceae bacterium]